MADGVITAVFLTASVATLRAMGALAAGATAAILFIAAVVAGAEGGFVNSAISAETPPFNSYMNAIAAGGFVNGSVGAILAGGRIKDIFLLLASKVL
ncbi:MAG: hypothetical protein NZM04_04925 [Methylacidiphilales bacterium]|nr:hypothetical protein [Candidatus Methylacidiphilales bacterium]